MNSFTTCVDVDDVELGMKDEKFETASPPKPGTVYTA